MREIENEIKIKIINRLHEIENEKNVEIIFAIESGSRAWGFESTDSDYDVRFVYKHELKWYLNVLPKRDVIEYPIVDIFDYSGWDIRKTLFLLNKSNPVYFEWLRSPIVYIKNEKLYGILLKSSNAYFNNISSIYHYLHMARGNFRSYLQSDMVKTKKYFYVLRPIMACMWIAELDEPPPMEFEKLLQFVNYSSDFNEIVFELLERKRSGVELGEEKRIPIINDFIAEKLSYFENHTKDFNPKDKPNSDLLDDILWEIVK